MAAIMAVVPSMTGLPKALDLSPLRGKILTESRSDNLTQHGGGMAVSGCVGPVNKKQGRRMDYLTCNGYSGFDVKVI